MIIYFFSYVVIVTANNITEGKEICKVHITYLLVRNFTKVKDEIFLAFFVIQFKE